MRNTSRKCVEIYRFPRMPFSFLNYYVKLCLMQQMDWITNRFHLVIVRGVNYFVVYSILYGRWITIQNENDIIE